MRKTLMIIGVIMFLVTTTLRSPISANTLIQHQDSNRNVIDTTGIIFMFQGKRVSSQWAIEKLKNNEIRMYGYNEPKKAIMHYGEKYRNGLFICETPKHETDE